MNEEASFQLTVRRDVHQILSHNNSNPSVNVTYIKNSEYEWQSTYKYLNMGSRNMQYLFYDIQGHVVS